MALPLPTSEGPQVVKKKKHPNFSKPQKIITIFIGGEKVKFELHRAMISHHSHFFEAAFSSNMQEGLTQRMTLEDIELEVFVMLAHWTYFQTLESDEDVMLDQITLGKLWIVAQRFLKPRLQNMVMDQLFKILPNPTPAAFCSNNPPLFLNPTFYPAVVMVPVISELSQLFIDFCKLTYREGSDANEPLRRLVAFACAYQIRANWLDVVHKLPRPLVAYVLDLLAEFMTADL